MDQALWVRWDGVGRRRRFRLSPGRRSIRTACAVRAAGDDSVMGDDVLRVRELRRVGHQHEYVLTRWLDKASLRKSPTCSSFARCPTLRTTSARLAT